MSARNGETRAEYNARRREQRKLPEQLKKAREQARRWRLNNPEKIRVINKKFYLKNPGARGKLKTTYGITPEQYDEMLAAQGGVCASCGGQQRVGRPLCVDHCHKTKRVRGLLCDACNVCAGHLESKRRILVERYLARQKWPGWDSWGNETEKFRVTA